MPPQSTDRSEYAGEAGCEPIEPIAFRPPPRRGRGRRWTLRIGALLAGLLVVGLALVAAFLFTARSLVVAVIPADAAADVRVEGGLVVPLGERYLLRPGEYRAHARAAGFQPLDRPFAVTEAHNQRLELRLRPLPGRLRVTSAPVDGAEVVVDGEPRGRTPLVVRDLEAGEHLVRITAARYRPFERRVEIAGRDTEQRLEVTLEPAWAEVTLRSRPPGAALLVDGEPAGTTPLTAEILEGERTFELRLAGHEPWRETVRVVAGQPLELPEVELRPADATLVVTTEPPGASVLADGVYQGVSPVRVAVRPQRRVALSAFKDGYRTARRTVEIGRGELEVTLALEPELGRVRIEATPEDAELRVDGEPRGAARQVLELPARPHRIEIRKAGYASYEATVTPRAGIEQRVEVTLKTLEQARREAIKSEIRTSEGQVLKLFRPGRFTMGASRREPGRRANEVLREVELTRPFYLAVREVTNAEFRRFANGHSSGQVQGHGLDGERQPVVRVTWVQAARYCNWLSERDGLPAFYRVEGEEVVGFDAKATGYRLPSEAEWAWAARSRPGGSLAKFSWGESFPPPESAGNFADQSAAALLGRVLPKYNDGYPVTAPVGSFPADANGLYDMAGNVAEWVHDVYDVPAPGAPLATDPLGPPAGELHAVRGSSWAHGSITELRLSFRDYGAEGTDDRGFRIARYVE